MKTISPFFILISLAVVVACIGFVAYAIRGRIRQTQEPSPIRQVIMLAMAAFLFANLGATLIAPTGPGSGMPLFLTVLLPCTLFLIIGPRLSRILAILLACVCIAGAWSEHRTRAHFGERMRARMEERRQDAMEKLKEGTEPEVRHVSPEAAPSASPDEPST